MRVRAGAMHACMKERVGVMHASMRASARAGVMHESEGGGHACRVGSCMRARAGVVHASEGWGHERERTGHASEDRVMHATADRGYEKWPAA